MVLVFGKPVIRFSTGSAWGRYHYPPHVEFSGDLQGAASDSGGGVSTPALGVEKRKICPLFPLNGDKFQYKNAIFFTKMGGGCFQDSYQ